MQGHISSEGKDIEKISNVRDFLVYENKPGPLGVWTEPHAVQPQNPRLPGRTCLPCNRSHGF